MAQVVYLDPIDHISGKIARRHRTTYNYRNASGRKYTSVYNNPTAEPTAAQVAGKLKFKQAAQQTNTIMTDVDQLAPYRTAWTAHLRNGNPRYTTLRGFIFAQVYKAL